MAFSGEAWSVDDILVKGQFVYRDQEFSLVRVVHVADHERTGIRYLLAANDCVDIREYQATDESLKLSYGLSYSFDNAALRAAVGVVRLGGVTRRIPVLTMRNMAACLRRRVDVEGALLSDIALATGNARTIAATSAPESGSHGTTRRHLPAVVTVFDVGQGDTILVQLPGDILWLIDAYFWSASRYARFKRLMKSRFGSLRLDRLVISHFHYDHIRYGVPVVRDFSPRQVVIENTLPHKTAATRNLLRECSRRGILATLAGAEATNVGGIDVQLTRTTDFPGSPSLGFDPNAHAIALTIRTDQSRGLLAGDIPGALLAAFAGQAPLATTGATRRFYKVSHHCSATGNDPGFFQIFPPRDAATSCAMWNRYGHPHTPPSNVIAGICRSQGGTHRITCQARTDLQYVIQ